MMGAAHIPSGSATLRVGRSTPLPPRSPAVCAAAKEAKLGPTCPSANAPMSTAMSVWTTLEPVKQPASVGSKRHAGCAVRDWTMRTPATMDAKP